MIRVFVSSNFSAMLCLMALALSPVSRPAFAAELGWVEQSSGTWTDQSTGKRLGEWSLITSDSHVVRAAPLSNRDYLVVRTRRGQLIRYDCGKPLVCDASLNIERRVGEADPAKSFGSLLVDFVTSVLARKPDLYSSVRSTVSRSVAASILVDYVSDGENVPAFALFASTAPKGDHLLDICPEFFDRGCPERLSERHINLGAQAAEPPTLSLPQGLHKVVLCQTVGGLILRTRDESLVFVPPAGRESDARKSFLQLQAELAAWVDEDEARTLLRSYLLYLSQKGVDR